MREFLISKNKHDVRRFVGLACFFRRFIPSFALICKPITDLLKNDTGFMWGKNKNLVFEEIKSRLVDKPIMKAYNSKAFRTELHTDASALGLGTMLLQADREKEPLSMVYAISRKTNECESKYHSSRLKLLAMAWALQRLRPLLIGISFVIVTDCQCLVNLNSWKTKNSQLARSVSEIEEFDFEVIHRSGGKMKHVVALSPSPVTETSENLIKESLIPITTEEDEIDHVHVQIN